MAGVATHLADKSALGRMRHPDVAARIAPLLGSGVLATCSITDLEVLYSARNGRENEEWRHAGVTLLHYDADFDLIASLTGQRCEWVVERGTVDQAGGLLAAGEPALVRQHHGLDAVA